MITAELLEHAADTVERVGHRKGLAWAGSASGAGEYRGGPVCAYGGLRLAATGLQAQDHLADAVVAVLRHLGLWDRLCTPVPVLAGWNDRAVTTAADVVDALRHAAKDLRNTA